MLVGSTYECFDGDVFGLWSSDASAVCNLDEASDAGFIADACKSVTAALKLVAGVRVVCFKVRQRAVCLSIPLRISPVECPSVIAISVTIRAMTLLPIPANLLLPWGQRRRVDSTPSAWRASSTKSLSIETATIVSAPSTRELVAFVACIFVVGC